MAAMIAKMVFEAGESLSDGFKQAMRQFPAAVSIITTGQGDSRRGLTATAVCGLSTEPPRVLVCINHNAEAHTFIHTHGTFCVNVLDVGQQDLAGRFAAADGSKGVVRFARDQWSYLTTGSPVLDGALASIDCRVYRTIEADTHTIVVGDVVDIRLSNNCSPLLYHQRDFHQLANIDLTKIAPMKDS